MSKGWYVVHTYSGYEDQVKASIMERAKKKGLEDKFGRILVPGEKVIEVRGNRKREAERKFYPGYIIVEMELNDDTWQLVRKTPRVTGFVGGTKPVPLPEDEVEVILRQVEKAPQEAPKMKYQKGELVRIKEGPFMNFNGVVEEIDLDHGRLKVMVSIFGRQTPVELSFYQVEKAEE